MFTRGSRKKTSFATVPGRGDNPNYDTFLQVLRSKSTSAKCSFAWIHCEFSRKGDYPDCQWHGSPKTYKALNCGQISIILKPELRGFWGSSLIKPPFRVTSADVVIICPD